MQELWKDIKGYEGKYQVSNFGRVKSLNYKNSNQEGYLTPSLSNRGYYRVSLTINGITKQFNIHRLVAETFLPNPSNLNCVNHKDENRLNNSVANLEWCSLEYNTTYGSLQQRSANSRKKPVICIETGVVYDSAKDAAEVLQLSASTITQCCKGHRKTHGKYHWKYA